MTCILDIQLIIHVVILTCRLHQSSCMLNSKLFCESSAAEQVLCILQPFRECSVRSKTRGESVNPNAMMGAFSASARVPPLPVRTLWRYTATGTGGLQPLPNSVDTAVYWAEPHHLPGLLLGDDLLVLGEPCRCCCMPYNLLKLFGT